jgi:signal transduction histidine kinase
LPDLAELVETARSAGMPVTLTLPRGSIPETVGLAAYRIVQEALANAGRHAPGQPVSVDVRVLPDAVEISVRNRLVAGVAAGSSGHGLIGMRERATLLGGSLTAASDETDFVVLARLPLESSS